MTIFKDDTIDGSEGNSRAGEKEYGIVLEDTNTEYRNKMEDYIWVMFKVMLVCFFVNSFYRSCCSIFVEIFGNDLSYKIRDQYLHKKFSTKFIINLISIFIILAISIFSLKKFFYLQDFVFLPMAQYETLVLITQAYASGIVLSFFKYAIDAIFIVKGKNPLKTYADDIISSLIGITVVKLIYNPSSEVIFISIGIAYLKHVMFKLIVRNAHKEF